MKIPENFMSEIRKASDECYNNAIKEYSLISFDQMLSIKGESIALAVIVGYHNLLREKLLKEGIDIGEFSNDD